MRKGYAIQSEMEKYQLLLSCVPVLGFGHLGDLRPGQRFCQPSDFSRKVAQDFVAEKVLPLA